MTTDRFPKMCALEVALPEGNVRLGVVRQGRGDDLAGHGHHAVRGDHRRGRSTAARDAGAPRRRPSTGSFNRVTVDGEMSTNDTVLFLASGASGVRPGERGACAAWAPRSTPCSCASP